MPHIYMRGINFAISLALVIIIIPPYPLSLHLSHTYPFLILLYIHICIFILCVTLNVAKLIYDTSPSRPYEYATNVMEYQI